jgi:hypothetical protein
VIRRAAIAAAALAAVLVTGCGGGGGGSSDQTASLVPPDAPVYIESVVRPEGAQRDAIDSLASRVGGIDDPGAAIVQQLDAQFSSLDITYEHDIAPWLGERAGVFFQNLGSSPPYALIVETTDPEAAQDFLKKVTESVPGIKQATYKGVQYIESAGQGGPFAAGIVGGFLVFGALNEFEATVDASNGNSLANSSAFQSSISTLPDDNLELGYADGQQVADQLSHEPIDPVQAAALSTALQTFANGPVTFAISATTDTASLDLSIPSAVALAGGDLVGHAPADSWFAVGAQNVGGILGSALDTADSLRLTSIADQLERTTGVSLKDAASWMHNGYASVAGTSKNTIHVGAVVGSSDPKASSKAITAAKKKLQGDADAKLSSPSVQGADTGFSAEAPESPQAIDVAQVGNQVVAALGPGHPGDDELHPKQALADDPAFQEGEDALGSDFSPLAFVSLPEFFVVAEKGGSASDPGYVAAKPYLQKLDYLMAGTSGGGGRTTVRFVVGVK